MPHSMFDAGWGLGDLLPALDDQQRSQLQQMLSATTLQTPWVLAALARCEQRYGDAADVYSRMGALPDAACARLEAGRHLLRAGRTSEAEAQLERSLAF